MTKTRRVQLSNGLRGVCIGLLGFSLAATGCDGGEPDCRDPEFACAATERCVDLGEGFMCEAVAQDGGPDTDGGPGTDAGTPDAGPTPDAGTDAGPLDAGPPPSGTLVVRVVTLGEDLDADGYTLSVGDDTRSVPINANETFDLPAGEVTIALDGLADGCLLEPAAATRAVVASAVSRELSLVVACATVGADVVIPRAVEPVEGDTGLIAFNSAANVSQHRYPAEELIGLRAGDRVVGIRFRLDGATTATWPSTNGTGFTRFDISMGAGSGPLGPTLADNFAETPVDVRSGPLVWDAGAFPVNAVAPHPFGPEVAFDRPFTYAGGDLVLEMRMSQVGETLAWDATSRQLGEFVVAGDPDATTATLAPFDIGLIAELVVERRSTSTAPPTAATTEGAGSAALDGALTAQTRFATEDLPGLRRGDEIVGLRLRLDGDEDSSPTEYGGFDRFDVTMGPSVAALGTAFADNFAGTATPVRSGAWRFTAEAFASGTPAAFGPTVVLPDPYVYEGGDLLVEVRASAPDQPLTIDALDAAQSAGQTVLRAGDPDATTGGAPASGTWVIEFVTRRTARPVVNFPVPRASSNAEGAVAGIYREPLTSQEALAEADLVGLRTGDEILGIRLRLDGSVVDAYPPSDGGGFARFDVYLGRFAGGTLRTTFADNYDGPRVQVRSGALTFDAGSFPVASGGPAPFGPPIAFDVPYSYAAGPLMLEVRSSTPSSDLSIDALRPETSGESAFAEGDDTATTATTAVFPDNWAMEWVVRVR